MHLKRSPDEDPVMRSKASYMDFMVGLFPPPRPILVDTIKHRHTDPESAVCMSVVHQAGRSQETTFAAEPAVPITTTSSSACTCPASSEWRRSGGFRVRTSSFWRQKSTFPSPRLTWTSAFAPCFWRQGPGLPLRHDGRWVRLDHLRVRDHLLRRLWALLHDGVCVCVCRQVVILVSPVTFSVLHIGYLIFSHRLKSVWLWRRPLQDVNRKSTTVVESWEGSKAKQSYSHSMTRNASVTFTWAFQRTNHALDVREAPPPLQEHAGGFHYSVFIDSRG